MTTIQDLDDVIEIFQRNKMMNIWGALETGQKDRTMAQA